jgi:hypothetical protein
MPWPEKTAEDIEAAQRAEKIGIGQYDRLNLKPWMWPPHFVGEHEMDDILAKGPDVNDPQKKFEAACLAKRLLDAGLSLFEPDPERALTDRAYRREIAARVQRLKANAQHRP